MNINASSYPTPCWKSKLLIQMWAQLFVRSQFCSLSAILGIFDCMIVLMRLVSLIAAVFAVANSRVNAAISSRDIRCPLQSIAFLIAELLCSPQIGLLRGRKGKGTFFLGNRP
jgi:hypothetical protein